MLKFEAFFLYQDSSIQSFIPMQLSNTLDFLRCVDRGLHTFHRVIISVGQSSLTNQLCWNILMSRELLSRGMPPVSTHLKKFSPNPHPSKLFQHKEYLVKYLVTRKKIKVTTKSNFLKIKISSVRQAGGFTRYIFFKCNIQVTAKNDPMKF